MWTREELKTRAKDVLRPTYWKAFVISLVLLSAGGGGSLSSQVVGTFMGTINLIFTLGQEGIAFIPFLIMFMVIAFGFGFAMRMFLVYLIVVGHRQYFLQAARGDVKLNYLGYGFKRERYFDILKTLLYRDVLNLLWYALFIVPGIIKAYAYSMVAYILAENPNIGHERAVKLSEGMTEGQKMEMFILDLSFMGWLMLGVLTCGLGTYFVLPYYDATRTELYLVLRQNALDKGLCTYEELGGKPPLQMQ